MTFSREDTGRLEAMFPGALAAVARAWDVDEMFAQNDVYTDEDGVLTSEPLVPSSSLVWDPGLGWREDDMGGDVIFPRGG